MASEDQKREWKEAAEAALAAKNERLAEERKRAELQLHLRQEGIAAEKETRVRADAQRIWIGEGGSVGEFNDKWEEMYQDILYGRTVEKLSRNERPAGHKPLTL